MPKILIICPTCKKKVYDWESNNRTYCSRRCSKLGRRQSLETIKKRSNSLKGHIVSTETRRKISLGNKGTIHSQKFKERIRQRNLGRKLSQKWKDNIKQATPRGKDSPHWKGGVNVGTKGYIFIYQPNHPHSKNHGYVQEHRLVMEKKLGRYLNPKEVVHHLDFNVQNNHPSNLHLFPNDVEHQHYHKFLRDCVRVELELL